MRAHRAKTWFSWEEVRVLFWDLVGKLIAFLYLVRWRISTGLRQVLTLSAWAIAMSSALFLLLEVAGALLSLQLIAFHLGLRGNIVALSAVLGMIWHRVREFGHLRRRDVLKLGLRSLLEESSKVVYGNKQSGDDFAKATLDAAIVSGEKIRVNANIMRVTPDRKRIRMELCFGEDYGKDFELELGKGGAGKAAESKLVIYIPSVRRFHGISFRFQALDQERTELRAVLYAYKPGKQQPFRSIVSAPIMAADKVFGVLNVDSPKADAFDLQAIEAVAVAGLLLGIMIDKAEPAAVTCEA